MTPRANSLSSVLVVTIVAINALGIGLILPVMPDLLLEVGDADIAEAAAIGGFLSLAFASMQVLFGPLLGALSDRFGRRPVLLVSLIASAIDYAILATSSSLTLFFVVRLLSGVSSATFSVANAALADTASQEERATKFGLTRAAFGLGFVLGPVLGGVLGELGPRAPFIAAAILCALAALACIFLLPETLAEENRRHLKPAECIPFAAFLKLRGRKEIAPLALVNFLDVLAGVVFPAVWAYFAVARFGWSPGMLGFALAVFGLSTAVVQAGLIRVFVSRLGESATAVWGLSLGVLGFLILSVIESGTLAIILSPLLALRAVAGTAITGLISRQGSDSEQGELQGILSGLDAFARLIAIPLMTQVFAFANSPEVTSPWPGAPFALSALFTAMALIVLVLLLRSSE